jgi:hypothetical protein
MSTVQSQLPEFLSGASERPYRELVQYHIRRTATRELQKAVLGEAELLPHDLQGYVMSYIDAANLQFGYDRSFWAQATCREAFETIIKVAIAALPISDRISSVDKALEAKNHNLAFQLFQIPTLSFAYSASTQRKQRKLMGIRKGLFG